MHDPACEFYIVSPLRAHCFLREVNTHDLAFVVRQVPLLWYKMAEEISHDPIVQMDENDPNVSKKTPMPSSRSHVQHSGLDNTNMHALRLFHAIVYDMHVDYSVTFWTELYEKVISKRTSKKPLYVPYQRFLQLIVRSMFRSNRDIPKRSHHEFAPEFEMRYLQNQKKTFAYSMPIPAALLFYVDTNSECIKENRESMGMVELTIHTLGSNLRRVESVRVPETMGVQRRGELRENCERGTGGSQDSQPEVVGTSAQVANRLEVSTSQPERTIIHQSKTIPSATSEQQEKNIHDANDEDENLQHSFGFLDDVSLHPENMEIDTTATNIQNVLGDIKRNEGVEVENSDNVRKSVIVENIQDISSPLMHLHTSTTHSIASQQALVSSLHRDITHTLSSFHSESLGTENRAQLPQSSLSFYAQSTLAPIALSTSIPRTLIQSFATIGCLSDPIETPVAASQSGQRGSGGSHVIATTMPAMNTGHTVESPTVVRTGSLSDPGVIFPDFMSKEFLNGALKVFEDRMAAKFMEELGKLVDLSVEELKSLLYAKLLSQAPTDESDADLIAVDKSSSRFLQGSARKRHDHDSERAQGETEREGDTEMVDIGDDEPVDVVEGEGMKLVLYVNEYVEPLDEKHVVATREQIMQLIGLETIFAIDLSSDEETSANENILDILTLSQDDIQLSPVKHDLPETTRETLEIPTFKDINIIKPSNQPRNIPSPGVSYHPKEYQEEYARMMSWVRRLEKYVKNKSGIVIVKKVRLVKFQRIWYPVFHVQTRDLTECELSETEFAFLNVDDIEYLYPIFRNMTVRPENIIFALEAVKSFMRRQVNYTYCYDVEGELHVLLFSKFSDVTLKEKIMRGIYNWY
ncbi:hypothetical protein L6452_02259 [Arctium lappa]|uniref:Uncharacterized protein n=1 Tax=Arctium lappa TaxID=4217 RepID=A0ACB9FJK4_ARCLA|nr:hypothetical protein L6452_02259 [Arctium lappa]